MDDKKGGVVMALPREELADIIEGPDGTLSIELLQSQLTNNSDELFCIDLLSKCLSKGRRAVTWVISEKLGHSKDLHFGTVLISGILGTMNDPSIAASMMRELLDSGSMLFSGCSAKGKNVVSMLNIIVESLSLNDWIQRAFNSRLLSTMHLLKNIAVSGEPTVYKLWKKMTKTLHSNETLVNQIILDLSTELQMLQLSVEWENPEGICRILNTWLVLCCYSLSNNVAAIEMWTSYLVMVAQFLFSKSSWRCLGSVACEIKNWLAMIRPIGVSLNAWYNLSLPVCSALRRPAHTAQLLSTLEMIIPNMSDVAVERTLFAVGGALQQMVRRGSEVDNALNLYVSMADRRLLVKHFQTILATGEEGDEWFLFISEILKRRNISIDIPGEIPTSLVGAGKRRNIWLQLVLRAKPTGSQLERIGISGVNEGCRDVVRNILKYAIENRLDLGSLSEILHSCNYEDEALRVLAMEVGVGSIRDSIIRLDDVCPTIGKRALENLNFCVAVSEEDMHHQNAHLLQDIRAWCDLLSVRSSFTCRLLDRVLECDPSLFRLVEEFGFGRNTIAMDHGIANWAASELVRTRLRSVKGNASRTLETIAAILGTNDTSRNSILIELMAIYMEKSLHVAMNTVASESPEEQKTHKFFYTNRQVCLGWLAQIRPNILKRVALHSPEGLWYGGLLLCDDHRMENVVRIGRSLVQRGEGDSLLDLAQWTSDDFSYQLVLASSLKASGQVEDALTLYTSCFANRTADMSSIRWCVNEMIGCMRALEAWDDVDRFLNELELEQEAAWALGDEALADALSLYHDWDTSMLKTSAMLSRLDRSGATKRVHETLQLMNAQGHVDFMDEFYSKLLGALLSDAEISNEMLGVHLCKFIRNNPSISATNDRLSYVWCSQMLQDSVKYPEMDSMRGIPFQSLGRVIEILKLSLASPLHLNLLQGAQLEAAVETQNFEFAKSLMEKCDDKMSILKHELRCGVSSVEQIEGVLQSYYSISISDPILCKNLLDISSVLATGTADPERYLQWACSLSENIPAAFTNCWLEYGTFLSHQGEFKIAATAFVKHITKEKRSNVMVACIKLMSVFEHLLPDPSIEEETPSEVWLGLLPQVMSNLINFPDSELVENLVLRLAHVYPKEILWELVVNQNRIPTRTFQKLRKFMMDVEYAESFITELVETAIWKEERWFALLTRLMAQKAKCVEAISSLQSNQFLDMETKKAKSEAVMAPTITALKNLFCSTLEDEPPSSSLRQSMLDMISMMDNFWQNGIDNCWTCVEFAHRKLGAWMKERQQESKLSKMADGLFNNSLKKTNVLRMPGTTTGVCIHSVLDKVVVLNTKTRPKKIWFQGDDGQTYGYLLKGGEDLRVDQHIMQFFNLVNDVLPGALRTYHVVPLGPRVGLIQWVEEATPILEMYRKWQQSSEAPGSGTEYHAMLAEQLKEKAALPRKEWPIEVLMQVFSNTCGKIPRDILARQIWVNSPNAISWWKRVELYTKSVASSSMVGHVIGLGDRHLDNILIDMSDTASSGQIVHIDYAVCFDKGRRLKVPEAVPFRLTHVMTGAFPFFNPASKTLGEHGTFATHCRKTILGLQQKSELFLSLIETLAQDPTINWRSVEEDKIDYSLDINVSVSLLLAKVNLDDSRIPLLLERAHIPVLSSDKLAGHMQDLDITLSLHTKSTSKVRLELNSENESITELNDAFLPLFNSATKLTESYPVTEGLLQSAIVKLRNQQSECERLRTQMVKAIGALQNEGALDRLHKTLSTSLGMLLSGDELTVTVRSGSDDSKLLSASMRMRTAAQLAFSVLVQLRQLLEDHSCLVSYGSDMATEDWIQWLNIARESATELLQVSRAVFSDLKGTVDTGIGFTPTSTSASFEHLIAPVQAIFELMSPPHILEDFASKIEEQNDSKSFGWRNASLFSHYKGDKRTSQTNAVKQHIHIRKALMTCQNEMNSSLNEFKALASHKDSESRRRTINNAIAAIKGVKTLVDSVVNLEFAERDLRISQVLDIDKYCMPLLLSVADHMNRVSQETALMSSILRDVSIKAGSIDIKLERVGGLKSRLAHGENERKRVSDLLEAYTRVLKQTAYTDNSHVWSNILNIKRGTNKGTPLHDMACSLMESKQSLKRKSTSFQDMVDETIQLRGILETFVSMVKTDTEEHHRKSRDSNGSKQQDTIISEMRAKLNSEQSIHEQVKQLTNQATSPQLLSRMYEGWMPFV